MIKILCIYSIEPNNPKIKICDKAVFNTSKNQNLFFCNKLINIRNMSLSEISSREKKVNISLNKFIKVQCLCIDELINKFNYVDLIKIDIEGQEYNITLSLYNKKYQ